MNVQPNASVVGATGTAKAQQNGSDAQVSSQQSDALKRADAPGKAKEGDSLTVGESGESGDRDGDGRQVIEIRRVGDAETESDSNPQTRRSVSLDGDGSELDFDA